jgi:tRNA (guanine-N7-)-methyltransferase
MSRRKLQKFSENVARANLIQPGKELFAKVKGNWKTLFFKNNNPIVLELGCGRGEYTVGMALSVPENNFIGVDIKGDRIWKGSKTADHEKLANVGFLRTQIQSLDDFFESDEVDEIWLTFPDPRPKKSDAKRRFTHPRFMEIYRRLLKPGGRVHLKTDNEGLYQYSIEIADSLKGIDHLQYTENLYRSELVNPVLEIRTHYENLFSDQGYTIKYLTFVFD